MLNLATKRVVAIAHKEWRLNSRFPLEYFASNLMSPLKSAVFMYFIYRGLLPSGDYSLGMLNRGNFQIFVLVGTNCHSLFLSSLYTFRAKMVMEKWWQTVTATLVSPASSLELIMGFILGSGTLNVFISALMFSVIALFFPVPGHVFLTSLVVLCLVALFGFGIGLIGATLSLCFEGRSFLYDYAIQALVLLSCFYYPIETLPNSLHAIVHTLPTFHAARLLQELFVFGSSPHTAFAICYLAVSCFAALILPAVLFDYSVKKYGIVGY